MHRPLSLVLVTTALLGSAIGQSNSIPGVDCFLYDIDSPTAWGRQGPAHPGGEIGFTSANFICNSGTVEIPFQGAMSAAHPKFAFMITRLSDDRMEQISDRSHCKHAFGSLNFNQGPCTPCQDPNNFNIMGIGCFDVYGASTNANRRYLGPADEIDPWLGTWNPVGSYFDQGDPNVGPPQNTDGIRSLVNSMTSTAAMGSVKNRVTVQEQDLLVPNASYFYMMHVIIEGEAVGARDNNLMSRGLDLSWNGSTWNEANVGTAQSGSVLTRWPGATLNIAGNGNDDGRIAVAVKVTGPTDGRWHYEYAVHNIDNSRGAASFRVPVCPTAAIDNLSFNDIDDNGINDWAATVSNGEIVWSAPIDNALRWNMLFNFSFDSDAAPTAGNATFDQALIGPGAASITVPTEVPGNLPNVNLGAGCGTPSTSLWGNGLPTTPNPNYSMTIEGAPATATFVFFSFGQTNTVIGPGCTQYLQGATPTTYGFFLTDAAGRATAPLTIPAGLTPTTVYFQAAALLPNGPALGVFGLSNGLAVRVGQTGCP